MLNFSTSEHAGCMERDHVTVYSHNEEETLAIGSLMGSVMTAGDIIGISGELGAGKTCIARGIAKGMGISRRYHITSPTFTLINEYPGEVPLYHMDMYRLSDSSDVGDVGYYEYLGGKGVAVVEWAEKIADVLPAHAYHIIIEHCNESLRKLDIEGAADTIAVLRSKFKEGGLT
jgi:tRNA threonylcarbamoyladenosine biosynthesis protein TsaE